ncbi:hypothetical protein [Pseudidiomarina donghaiensis]|uniref:Uncharacterized protein n=1 Tax=Pseudidiomarina donghaiensis TaxID=519452 RepID=A0A432XCW2_9GAMM|nr:hypothetical protein [Pseudidiomarina donghaiensis]RUO46535.1 hypothetical protein CWE24_11555 [Pseudidiomarina donghaiensis]SFV24604.1 hypothetical protein SAMN04488139_2358 [Pseudidiomarina donghaiensis]
MTKILKVWGCHWKSATLVPAPFKVKTSWFKKVTSFSGFAYKHKGEWLAVWKDGEQLVLQSHTGKWPIGHGECHITYTGDGVRRLEIKPSDGQPLCLEYNSTPVIEDPTHDAVDEETEDFFVWVCRVWNDPAWASALLTRYS